MKRLVYLISPNKLKANFYLDLDKVLSFKNVKYFQLRLKNTKRANIDILRWAKRNVKKPIIAIGGINNHNYKKLIKAGAKYIAISSFIWDNPKLKPELAIRKFK